MFADAAVRLAGLAGWGFGWGADAFWRATPAELAAVVRAAAGDAAPGDAPPLGASDLAALIERFPDA